MPEDQKQQFDEAKKTVDATTQGSVEQMVQAMTPEEEEFLRVEAEKDAQRREWYEWAEKNVVYSDSDEESEAPAATGPKTETASKSEADSKAEGVPTSKAASKTETESKSKAAARTETTAADLGPGVGATSPPPPANPDPTPSAAPIISSPAEVFKLLDMLNDFKAHGITADAAPVIKAAAKLTETGLPQGTFGRPAEGAAPQTAGTGLRQQDSGSVLPPRPFPLPLSPASPTALPLPHACA